MWVGIVVRVWVGLSVIPIFDIDVMFVLVIVVWGSFVCVCCKVLIRLSGLTCVRGPLVVN